MSGLVRKYAAFLVTAIVLASCSATGTDDVFRRVDKAIEDRETVFHEYETLLETYKDSLRNARSDEDKWLWADRLYESYRHYDLDSAYSYSKLQRRYCTEGNSTLQTTISEARILILKGAPDLAEELFRSIDTVSVRNGDLYMTYLKGAVSVYSELVKCTGMPGMAERQAMLRQYRNKYLAADTTSFYAKRTLAQHLRDSGDLEKALEIFLSTAEVERNYHNLTSCYYNIAMIYDLKGDVEQKIYWLTKSAECDFKAPNRDYLALYQLAVTLYEKGDYERAGRYIQTNVVDVIAGNFPSRIINSSKVQQVIYTARRHSDRMTMIILVIALCIFAVFGIVISLLLRYSYGQSRKLKRIKDMLVVANQQLRDANIIKDNYVFRYMEQSIRYLDMVETIRHDLRILAKSGDINDIRKALRSPDAMYDEYKQFYKVFDDTFLGIFPNFIRKVNALLKEEARYPYEDERTLTTELRILASIRLGIRGSREIASFLKCSVHTVYTYRNRMKNAALCPRDEFEERLKNL